MNEAVGTATVQFWRELNLEALRHKLDEQGLQVAEAQETSVKSRRRLAETTRDFRRGAEQGVLAVVAPLLKSYQEEVDKLTNRAKFGEAAFLDLYQKLYEAPDPTPALASAMEAHTRCAELEVAAQRTAAELAEFQAESRGLVNQQHTVRRLEEAKRGLEAQLAAKEEEVAAARQEAALEAERRAGERDQEREAALAAELAGARAALGRLQRQHEESQRAAFDTQSRTEAEQAALAQQLELAGAEVESAHGRLAALEAEAARAAQHAGQNGVDAGARERAELSAQVERLRSDLQAQRVTAGRLEAEAAAAHEAGAAAAAEWRGRADSAAAALAARESHVAALEKQLAARPTPQQVAELEQQVRALEAVVGVVAEDGDGAVNGLDSQRGSEQPPGGAAPSPQGATVEGLLLAKGRRLEHELTQARLRVATLSGDVEKALARASQAETAAAERGDTVARLEEDLLAAQQAGRQQGPPGAQPRGSGDGGDLPSLDKPGPPERDPSGAGEWEERTMLGVVCGQRDRLRARVRALEEQSAQAQGEMERLRASAEAGRADAVALLERLRYVQSYQGQQALAQAQGQGQTAARRSTGGGDVESRVSRAYEEKLNPFGEFRDRERAQRRRQLSPPDRAVYELGQLLLNSRWARLALAAYAVVLHVMVFGVLALRSHRGHGPVGAAELAQLCQHHTTLTTGGRTLLSALLRL